MENIVKSVFENHQIRKNKAQKSNFITFTEQVAADEGYSCSVERGSLGARNIVVGDPESAKVVYTAHYDTCAVMPMPNFITPKNFLIYILYQIFMVLVLMYIPVFVISFLGTLVPTLIGAEEPLATAIGSLLGIAALIGSMLLLIIGPANKHTANDNTSGVITLFAIMKSLPKEQRDKVAFIFFDLEEAGLIGSSGYREKHKNAMKNKLLINFDCVSDGKSIIFALKKGARKYESLLAEAFPSTEEYNVEILSRGVFYPSDQGVFAQGVGVAALNKSKRLGILYMNRIHTPKDTVFDYSNIEYLARGAVSLSKKLDSESEN